MASPEEMVRNAYRNVLGRDPDPGGMQNYLNALKFGWEGIRDQGTLEADLRRSDEYLNRSRGGSGGGSGGGEGGGGGGSASPPISPAQIRENQFNTAQNQVDILKKFGPEMSKYYLDSLKQFGPEFAQTQQGIIEGLYPEQSQVGENASSVINSRLSQGAFVPEELKKLYRQFRLEADSSRGLENSGLSAEAESLGLAQLAFDIQQKDIASAIALNAGVPKVQVSALTPGSQGPVFNDYYGATLAANTNLQIASMQDSTRRYVADQNYSLGLENLGLRQDLAQPANPFGVALGQFSGSLLGGIGEGIADGVVSKLF